MYHRHLNRAYVGDLKYDTFPCLTHGGWDNMATISQKTNWNAFYLTENVLIMITISLNFIPKGPISNIPSLFQIMAWHQPEWIIYIFDTNEH